MLVCDSMNKCAKAIKLLNKMRLDGKNIRSSKRPGVPTIWEIQQALDYPSNVSINRKNYKAHTLANGDVQVTDKLTGKVYYRTAGELAQREFTYRTGKVAPASIGGGSVSLQGADALGAQIAANTLMQNNVGNNNMAPSNKNRFLAVLGSVAAAAALVTGIVASFEKIASAKNTGEFISNSASKIGGAISSLFKSKRELSNINGVDTNRLEQKVDDLQRQLKDVLINRHRFKVNKASFVSYRSLKNSLNEAKKKNAELKKEINSLKSKAA